MINYYFSWLYVFFSDAIILIPSIWSILSFCFAFNNPKASKILSLVLSSSNYRIDKFYYEAQNDI